MNMAGHFQPKEAGLRAALKLLTDSQSPDTATQIAVETKLKELNKNPNFNYYLMYVLKNLTSEDVAIRSCSGVFLKLNIRAHFDKFQPEDHKYFWSESLLAFGDPSPLIRATVCSLVSTIVSLQGGIANCPVILQELGEKLFAEHPVCEGALGALQLILEDTPGEVLCGPNFNHLIPKFVEFFEHNSGKIRSDALICVILFIKSKNPYLKDRGNCLIQKLGCLARDNDAGIRRNVCHALTLVVLETIAANNQVPNLDGIMKHMLERCQDENETVALEACEFLFSIAKCPDAKEIILKYLCDIVPLLITVMRFSENEIMRLGDVEKDDMIPDREEDIPLSFHTYRSASLRDLRGVVDMADEDDGDDEDSSLCHWNIRKCAASALGELALVFKDGLLSFLEPTLILALSHPEWAIRESGIYAAGAVADGCSMDAHLADLISSLIGCVRDKKFFVRAMACWALSRYARWVSGNPDLLRLVTTELLHRIAEEENKRVQESACASFATLLQLAGVKLEPFLGSILEVLVIALSKYQRKNLVGVYDLTESLANSIAIILNRTEYRDRLNALILSIINKMTVRQKDDRDLAPLLECISSLSTAIWSSFSPYSAPVFRRCLSLLEHNQEEGNYDVMVAALDLLSVLTERHRDDLSFGEFIGHSNIVQILRKSTRQHSSALVRRSSFVLLGELTKACVQYIRPLLPEFLETLELTLVSDEIHVVEAAISTMGTITVYSGPKLINYIQSHPAYQTSPRLIIPLKNILKQDTYPRRLLEITAVALGSLSVRVPGLVAPYLEEFAKQWFEILKDTVQSNEKEFAFQGMCSLIERNPGGLQSSLVFFCDAVTLWEGPPLELRVKFGQILSKFKNDGGLVWWNAFTASIPAYIREKIKEKYGV